MLKSILALLSGNALTSLLLFGRNLLIARLISVEDYGLAATFALSMAVVEMASGLGLQQLIVQNKDGDKEEFQAGLQMFQLVRAIISGVLLFLLAHPIARFLGVEHMAWAYQALAFIPLVRGFEHFDIHRLTRHKKYKPLIYFTLIPALVSVICVLPLHQFFPDYRVMLFAMIIQWVLGVAVSHVYAERPYRLKLDRKTMTLGLQFGWPILLNNFLLFAVLQGDKTIVARELGMTNLAWFAMATTLTMTPLLVISRSQSTFFLPRLSAAQSNNAQFNKLAMMTMQTSLVAGAFLVLGFLLLGEPVVRLLLGVKYEAMIPLLVLFAVHQACRNLKVGGTIAALAKAQTANAMWANLARLTTFPLAWYWAVQYGNLTYILVAAIAGEIMGFVVSTLLLRRYAKVPLGKLLLPSACFVFLCLVALSPTMFPTIEITAVTYVICIACFVLLLALSNEIRAYVSDSLRRRAARKT